MTQADPTATSATSAPTGGDGYLSALCAITLPMGPPPEDLADQIG